MRHFKRISIGFLGLLSLCFVIFTVLVTSPFFRELRVEKSAAALSSLLGQRVVIEGDARVSLLRDPGVHVTKLKLPAEEIEGTDLAVLELVRFPLPIGLLLKRWIPLPQIEARGLTILLLRKSDGRTSWEVPDFDRARNEADDPESAQFDIITFLGERDVSFADMALRIENEKTGFEFDFELDTYTVRQVPSGQVLVAQVETQGRVNGQPFFFDGDFPTGQPFDLQGRFGELGIQMSGIKPEGLPRGDFDAQLTLETSDMQDFVDLLRLEGAVPAAADATVNIVRRNKKLDLDDIDLNVQLDSGEVAQLTGRFADARFGLDFDLTLGLDLVGTNAPPPPAVFLKDVRLKQIEARIRSDDGLVEIDRFFLQTNARDTSFRDIGPFRVGRVQRSDDGQLQLTEASFAIGPEDRPFLSATASIDNLLTLEGYKVAGALDLPADQVLFNLPPERVDDFGRLVGELSLLEVDGEPFLETFEARSADSDLWRAAFDMRATDLENIEINVEFETDDGRKTLEALGLETVDVGAFGSDLTLSRMANEVAFQAETYSGATSLNTDVTLSILDGRPALRGNIQSDKVDPVDLRQFYFAVRELLRVRSLYGEGEDEGDAYQPLVLPSSQEEEQLDEDLSEFQPLVLPQEETAPVENEDVTEFQPLVISDNVGDIAIEDVLDLESIAESLDAEIAIEVAQITGQTGLSGLNSQLTMKSGDASLGPVRVSLGQGSVDFAASMNVIDAPDQVRVAGQTSGWDLGEILDQLGNNPGAYGTLNGAFDVTGQRFSVESFLKSARGTATIDLVNGRVSSALIELAGLGVLPWLFSQERRQGFADIVCLKAPLSMQNGRIEASEAVLETRRVQLVATGAIDLRNDQIAIRAEPRPVGRPLARSAWPIQVSGRLSDPTIEVAQRRTRRTTVPLVMPEFRTPCVPDVAQLQQETTDTRNTGPR